MGLVDRCEGSIAYNGASLVGLKTHAINRLGPSYVPEYRGVFSDLTVADNLNIAALKTSDWAVADILELFSKLRQLLDRRGRHLFGGNHPLLDIRRALLSPPMLLLLVAQFGTTSCSKNTCHSQ